ncbi:unnamed protein product [Camellia sinensis]
MGFVVVETNFRMYACSSSKLHCEFLLFFSRDVCTTFVEHAVPALLRFVLRPFSSLIIRSQRTLGGDMSQN